ncbi:MULTISPECIES: hypothetical protein [Burkholderia]|nr:MULTISPECIES: hypothetical protein [Burkholderia]
MDFVADALVHGEAAIPQQHMNPAIAVTALLRGDGHHPASQRFVVNSAA